MSQEHQITIDEYLVNKPRFNGSDYDSAKDQDRLTGQIKRIFDLMKDGSWRTLSEIEHSTGDPPASISAQLRHLRKPRFGGFLVDKRRRGAAESGLFEYRLNTREAHQKDQ